MKKKIFEQFVTYALMFLLMGMFTALAFGDQLKERTVAEGRLSTPLYLTVFQGLVYAGCALVIAMNYRSTLKAAKAAWPFLLIPFVALASTAWSVDPALTLRRAGVVCGTTLFGIYLGGKYTTLEFQGILLRSFLALIGLSILCLVVAPATVMDPSHSGAFRGLTEHKNLLGEFMGHFLLVAFTYRFRSEIPLFRTGTVLCALAILLLARSGSALISTAAGFAVLPLLLLIRFKWRQALPLTALGVCAFLSLFWIGWSHLDVLLAALGKDKTLTGRSEIWSMVGAMISLKPWLGYGYDAFWQGLQGPSLGIVARMGWEVPHSHNGYLEALLGMGIVGMAVMGFAVLRTLKDSLLYVRAARGMEGFWPFAYMVYYLVHATAEASLIRRDGYTYLLCVVLCASLALNRKTRTAKQTFEPPAWDVSSTNAVLAT